MLEKYSQPLDNLIKKKGESLVNFEFCFIAENEKKSDLLLIILRLVIKYVNSFKICNTSEYWSLSGIFLLSLQCLR